MESETETIPEKYSNEERRKNVPSSNVISPSIPQVNNESTKQLLSM